MQKIFSILSSNEKYKIVIIFFLIVITAFLEILLLFCIQPILQIFLNTNPNFSNINLIFVNYTISNYSLFLIFFLTFFLRNIFYALTCKLKNSQIKNLHVRVSNQFYSGYLNKNYIFFLKNNSSKLISNITTEIDNFCFRVIDSYLIFITEIFLIFSVIIFLFYKFFFFSLILFVFCFILFFLTIFLFKKKINRIGLEKSDYDSRKINNLQKVFHVIQSIKLDNNENFFIKKFNEYNINSVKRVLTIDLFNSLNKPIWEIIVLFSFSLTMFIGYNYFDLFRNDLVLIVATFVISFFRFLPCLNRILYALNCFKFYSPSINLIHAELVLIKKNLFAKEIIDKKDFICQFNNQIEVSNVSFKYTILENSLILENLNFVIKKNSINLIKGKSGSGKSTLLNIISGLLEPNKGQVLVDNININNFLRSYQKKIGYVSQRTLLTDDTISDNITFGQNKNLFDEKLFQDVIKKSHLEKLINKLPQGTKTLIGEKGTSLSGGEQQRIGIARALYKCPEILILDEATSALDELTEDLILKEVLDLSNSVTIILVSHKQLNLDKKHQLFELNEGKIVKNN
jgi:ABC-type multidrug transport system fused ATPase/permease subunit